jgi:predicted dehydrogenase
LLGNPDVDVVGVCRKGTEELSWVQRRFDIPNASEDYRDILALDLDACVVASPAGHHYEHAKAALLAGAHVLCEKPMTIDAGQAWDLVRLAEAESRTLVVAFGWNFNPIVRAAHEALSQGGIGKLEHLTVHMTSATRSLLSLGRYGTNGSLAPETETWVDSRVSGGGYAQAQLSHALGIALGLTGGRALSAFALMTSPLGGGVEQHAVIAYEFDGGAIAAVSGGSGHEEALAGKHSMEVRAIGSEGQMLLDLERESLRVFDRDGRHWPDFAQGVGAYECAGPLDAVLMAARGRVVENHASGELGARTVEALELAYLSAHSGRIERRKA